MPPSQFRISSSALRASLASLALVASSSAAPVAQSAETSGTTADVRLVLADEPIPAVLALLEKFTGKTVLADPALPKGKITFRPPAPLTKADTVVAIESLLALNGVALTPMGEKFLKAVPTGAAASQGAPELHLNSVRDLPPSERVVARLFSLRDADAASLAEKIRPLLTARAVITVMRDANALLVTDSLSNLIRVESFVERLDTPPASISLEIKNGRAETLATKLKALVAGAYKRRLRGDTTIDAIDGANRIAITTDPANANLLKELVGMLDTESGTAAKVEVFPLRHAEATKIATVVTQLASSRTGGAGAPGVAYGAAGSPAPAAGDERFSSAMSLVADERSNSLVAQGSPEDIAKLRKLVNRLDVLLPQVRIEATIVEVTLGDGEVSGLDSLGIGFKASGDTGVTSGDYRFATGTATLPNTGERAFGINGSVKDLSLAAAFNKSELRNKVKVLSSPNIVTTHNKKGFINVSQSQPIITGSTISDNSTATRSTVSYRDIGIKLEVTPRIGDNGVIQMEVTQAVENIAGSTTIDGNSQPLIGKREATSFLTASDREVIVLAGLQSTAETTTLGKVWLLGDIPGLGYLFRPETVLKERRELIIFLKPYVVDAAKQKNEPTPGLRPDALTAPDANKFIGTGIAPSPLRDTWAEEEKKREAEAAARAANPPREPVRGMHD